MFSSDVEASRPPPLAYRARTKFPVLYIQDDFEKLS